MICRIIFGEDSDRIPKFDYKKADGTVVQEHFFSVFRWIEHDIEQAGLNPINLMFPGLKKLGIGAENRRNARNLQSLNAALH